jgi:enoyl-CoA hydratase
MTEANAPHATVHYELSKRVARITLARPPVNALTFEMVRAVVASVKQAATDRQARVVMLSSSIAKCFSAGLDLDTLIGKSGEDMRRLLQELYIGLYDAQHDLGKPSIAVVGGAARGGGMTIAVSCDIVVAGERATFGYPEIDVGLIPAIHFAHLPRLIGRHRAFELLFSGRTFDAKEGFDLGIINRIVPDAELDSEAMKLATQFAEKSEAAVRLGRAAFMRQIDLDYRRSMKRHFFHHHRLGRQS